MININVSLERRNMILPCFNLIVEMEIYSSSGIYRIWEKDHCIPRPSEGVDSVEIKIDGEWQNMPFNKVWGKSFDSVKREGTWLKQKSATTFNPRGKSKMKFSIRFWVIPDSPAHKHFEKKL